MNAEIDILSQDEIDNLLEVLKSSDDLENNEAFQELQKKKAMSVYSEDMSIYDEKKGYKLYNFRRPDKFSKDHLRALQDIHKEFSRQFSLVLAAYLRMPIEINIISVDQLTYDEFTRSMPSPLTIGIVEFDPLNGQILTGLSHEVITSVVDRMLGGVGNGEDIPRELTDIEESLARKVLERLIKSLEIAWKNIIPVRGSVIDIDNSYSFIQVCNPGEIVALVTFEVQISNKQAGLLSLCFPYPVLEIVLSQLSSQHIFQAKGVMATPEDQENLLEHIEKADIGLNVLFGETDISLKDFLDLKEGDVVKLNNTVNENLLVCVNGERKFYARPGTNRKYLAIKITDVYTQSDN
ncbi:MAG: flagellar motor switch protein FliM [Candidatus Gastranaerophilales bacterium]|nr:flagellar motor switch protein FliM [Candidatus Gastranaerophilales bacterium]